MGKDMVRNWCGLFLFFFLIEFAEIVFGMSFGNRFHGQGLYVGFNHMDSKLEKNVVIAVLCLKMTVGGLSLSF